MQTFRSFRSILVLLAAIGVTCLLTGCMQIEQVVNLKSDGSGTVVLSIRMSKETLKQLKGLGGGEQDGDPLKDAFKESEIGEMEKKMGDGVKFVKVEAFSDDKWTGKKATFSFTDIAKLKLDLNMKGPSDAGDQDPSVKKDSASFAFTKGSPATLVIKIDKAKAPETAAAADQSPEEDAAQLAMMQSMLKDMRMTTAVNVEGKIVSTDATASDGSRIVLLDLPVGELMKDKAKFKALDKANDWQKLVDLLKGVPGVKIETKPEVKVQFE